MTLLQAYGIQFILNMKFWNGTQRIQCNEEKHNTTLVLQCQWNSETKLHAWCASQKFEERQMKTIGK